MRNMLIPIGKLFNLEKGNLQSSKCTPGKYNFITAAQTWKTHNSFDHDCEALIIAVAASGSLGRTHYINGEFISSDLCFILTPKDNKKYPINLSFYHFVFNSMRAELVSATKSGTSKESINQKNFKKYDLPYFDIKQQNLWINKLQNTLSLKKDLISELTNQQSLLKKLRQQILQEAIEGKLTKDWREEYPNIEPASELLKRIKTEKEQLIKDKKIKKQKPFPPVNKDEFPFELPEDWTWCRLGEVILNSDNYNIHKELPENEMINYVDIDAIDNKNQKIRKPKLETVSKLSSRARRVLKKGYILYSLVRPYLHNLAIVEEDKKNYIGSTGFAVFDCLLIENKYIFWLLLSKYLENHYLKLMDGFNSPSITHVQFNNTKIPLPPIEEQKAIIEIVENLMQKITSLENEIKQCEQNAEMLMQAILNKSFESCSKV
jgi:type I restriction enzyme, S subunit